jgi:hypothetical protein
MIFIAREEAFICGHCEAPIEPLGKGTYRNHCPKCLWSKHVDDQGPGDRASLCQGLMKPTGLDHDGKRGWTIIHVCEKCGKKIVNKTAPDDDMSKIENSPI